MKVEDLKEKSFRQLSRLVKIKCNSRICAECKHYDKEAKQCISIAAYKILLEKCRVTRQVKS